MVNEPSIEARREYNGVPVIFRNQWAFMLSKDDVYRSYTFTKLSYKFGSYSMDFIGRIGAFFQEVAKVTKFPSDIIDLPNQILSTDYISPDMPDDIRRVNKICSLYRSISAVGGHVGLDRLAVDVRKMQTEIIWISNQQSITDILGELGIASVMDENDILTKQQAIDAIWFLSRFATLCVRYVEMFFIWYTQRNV